MKWNIGDFEWNVNIVKRIQMKLLTEDIIFGRKSNTENELRRTRTESHTPSSNLRPTGLNTS